MTATAQQGATVGRDFILAGRAIFTVQGDAKRYTFRVRRAEPTEKHPNPDAYFVMVMTGTSNEDSYTYLGMLSTQDGRVFRTRNAKLPATDPAMRAAQWVFPAIWAGNPKLTGRVYHAGRCGRCARLLTDPDSIRTGIGPECQKLLGVPVRKADVDAGWGGAE